jgi:hypothetical protein
LRTREAVAGDTPASRATSVRVLAATATPGGFKGTVSVLTLWQFQTLSGKRLPIRVPRCIMDVVGMRFPNQLEYYCSLTVEDTWASKLRRSASP